MSDNCKPFLVTAHYWATVSVLVDAETIAAAAEMADECGYHLDHRGRRSDADLDIDRPHGVNYDVGDRIQVTVEHPETRDVHVVEGEDFDALYEERDKFKESEQRARAALMAAGLVVPDWKSLPECIEALTERFGPEWVGVSL